MTMADLPTVDDVGVGPRADRPKRRTFTPEYKDRILAELDAAEHGQRDAILGREGFVLLACGRLATNARGCGASRWSSRR